LSDMSYNGVGLQTPRGSGTNGYVQRNLAAVPTYRKQVFADDFKKPPTSAKKPNLEIIEHERKRQVEVQLVLYEEKLANMKYSEEEIARKVEKVREQLIQRLRSGKPITDDGPVVETHELSAAKEKEMARISRAFGITKDHVEGAVFEKMGYEGERQEKTREKELIKQQNEQKAGPTLPQNWLLEMSRYNSDDEEEARKKKAARKRREDSKKDHKKKSRSQSPDRSRSRSRGRARKHSQETDRSRNRERDREREKAKTKTKGTEKPKEKSREKNKEKETREKERGNEKEKDRGNEKEKDRGNEKEKDRGNEKEKARDKEKEKARDKEKEKARDKEKRKGSGERQGKT